MIKWSPRWAPSGSTAPYWSPRSVCTGMTPAMPLEVYAAYPDRFRLVKPVDPTDPAVFETIADWSRTRGTVGIRFFA